MEDGSEKSLYDYINTTRMRMKNYFHENLFQMFADVKIQFGIII